MGWSSGTEIAEVFEKLLLKYVPKNKLKKEAKEVLRSLEYMDWDCQEDVELFDYLSILDWIDDEDDEDTLERMKEKIKKYKKKFGF